LPAVLVAALALAGCGHSGSAAAPTPEPISANLWVWTAEKSDCGTDRWLAHPDPMTGAYEQADDGYHLTASSPAIDAGDEELCARYTGGRDIDGDRRSGRCDAGPDEYVP
jgi:hypothetical protein